MSSAKEKSSIKLPSETTLLHSSRIAVADDKPIMLDYWLISLEKKAIIGVKENGEKILVKSEEEYTSPISKIYKVMNEYIIMTENSIYLVDNKIPTKRISS
jgi:DNA-binding GntR family transcriptional regulator